MARCRCQGRGPEVPSLECQRERIHHGTRGAAGPHSERHGRQVFRGASLTLHHGLPRPVTACRLHHEVTTPTCTTSYISSINTGVPARGARVHTAQYCGKCIMYEYVFLHACLLCFILPTFTFLFFASPISFRILPRPLEHDRPPLFFSVVLLSLCLLTPFPGSGDVYGCSNAPTICYVRRREPLP